MPTRPKIVLNIDPESNIGKFFSWYEQKYTTVNENGRKRKGNAKKALMDFMGEYISRGGKVDKDNPLASISNFLTAIEEYKETGSLPTELKEAKMYLSAEDFEDFKDKFYKINKAKNELLSANASDKIKEQAQKRER